jgi:hypothetical protein
MTTGTRARTRPASPRRTRSWPRLDPVKAGRRLANYLKVMTLEAQTIARACGKSHLHNLEPEDLCALTLEAAAMAQVPLAGTSWIPARGWRFLTGPRPLLGGSVRNANNRGANDVTLDLSTYARKTASSTS